MSMWLLNRYTRDADSDDVQTVTMTGSLLKHNNQGEEPRKETASTTTTQPPERYRNGRNQNNKDTGSLIRAFSNE